MSDPLSDPVSKSASKSEPTPASKPARAARSKKSTHGRGRQVKSGDVSPKLQPLEIEKFEVGEAVDAAQ